jgi:hypothetical protein
MYCSPALLCEISHDRWLGLALINTRKCRHEPSQGHIAVQVWVQVHIVYPQLDRASARPLNVKRGALAPSLRPQVLQTRLGPRALV